MFRASDILKKRIYALTTDFFIIVITNYFIMASFAHFTKSIFFRLPFRLQLFFIHKLEIITSVTLVSLLFSYFAIFYFVTNGRTMGKILFGLKIVSHNGDITLKQSMQRSIAYFTCAMLGSFLFALSFIRKDEKSLADIISGTSVVYDQKIKILLETTNTATEVQLTLMDAIQQDETISNDIESCEKRKSA